MDKERIKYHIKGLLEAIGEDSSREGLLDTPERVANAIEEQLAGINLTNAQIAEMFGKTFESPINIETADDIVIVKDIDAFSYCEHHLALMYDMKITVAYIPRGKILGLSKIARIAETAAKRLTIQERLGRDISEIIQIASGSEDAAVFISAKHSCITARGIKNVGSLTTTSTLTGRFLSDERLRNKLYLELKCI
ncbi:MAG: GTP cyclohydrolase I [Ruminococcus sp.]|jgi:GTP cyclohydrolase I|nr:GTP cyclohydrolase I [Ruminococcus sp.]